MQQLACAAPTFLQGPVQFANIGRHGSGHAGVLRLMYLEVGSIGGFDRRHGEPLEFVGVRRAPLGPLESLLERASRVVEPP